MGNYYSVQIDDIMPEAQDPIEEPVIVQTESHVDVQPNFDPNEIFHSSAFDSPHKRITDSQYSRVISFSKDNKYVRCGFCGYLTLFGNMTKGGRFTHPLRETVTIIKNENTHEDIMCLECKHCNYDIEVKI